MKYLNGKDKEKKNSLSSSHGEILQYFLKKEKSSTHTYIKVSTVQ